MALKDHYKTSYGSWAGNEAGHSPNFKRCCKEVADNSTNWPRYHQCRNKNGHGPDGAFCRVHDPVAIEKRAQASEVKYLERCRRDATGYYGDKVIQALIEIERGHNDPRHRAKEALDQLRAAKWWKEPE